MIVRKQLLVVVNKMCSIASIDSIKENMLDGLMRLMPVSFEAIVAPPVEERRLIWTTYDNLHTWFMSFKEFCFKFKFAMPSCNGDAVFCRRCSAAQPTLMRRNSHSTGVRLRLANVLTCPIRTPIS